MRASISDSSTQVKQDGRLQFVYIPHQEIDQEDTVDKSAGNQAAICFMVLQWSKRILQNLQWLLE